jgi:hypothetical protein
LLSGRARNNVSGTMSGKRDAQFETGLFDAR